MHYIFEVSYWTGFRLLRDCPDGRQDLLSTTVIAKTFDEAMAKTKKKEAVTEFVSVVNTRKHVTI